MLMGTLDVIGSIWPAALLGTGLALVGTGLGWALARSVSLTPVRLVTWWVRRVALPILHSRSWARRASAILINNVLTLAALTALGRWYPTALLGVAVLGISLGIGLRILSNESEFEFDASHEPSLSARRTIRIGIALNLLEPPAIMLAIGLGLGRSSIPLTSAQVWTTFALWVIPAVLVAAAGEALWLGVIRRADRGPDTDSDETAESDMDRP